MYHYPNVFLYGFQPFLHYPHNITAEIISLVEKEKLAPSHVFPVNFVAPMFDEQFTRHAPQIIIGMGQMERARKIRIERTAVNSTSEGDQINPLGPPKHYVSLKLPSCEKSTITYDAGDYVCNFSMYLGCQFAVRTNAQYAFLHIPMQADPNEVVSFIKTKLQLITT